MEFNIKTRLAHALGHFGITYTPVYASNTETNKNQNMYHNIYRKR